MRRVIRINMKVIMNGIGVGKGGEMFCEVIMVGGGGMVEGNGEGILMGRVGVGDGGEGGVLERGECRG